MAKWAIVTGGAGGLGKCICEALVPKVDGVLSIQRTSTKPVRGIQTLTWDVTTPPSALMLWLKDHAHDEFVLVHNAAAKFIPGPLHLTNRRDVESQWRVSVDGFMNCLDALLPLMARTKRGTIVAVLSEALAIPAPKGYGAYRAAKSGLKSLLESVASEYGGLGIRAFAVAPGYMETNFTARWPQQLRSAMTSGGHALAPQSVAARIAELVNDPSVGCGETHEVRHVTQQAA